MSKYVFTEEMNEISGFGGGYETGCRDMVVAGLEWLDNNPKANPTFDQYKNIYGLTTNENKDMEKMQDVMLKVCDGCSGAMMQATTNHVLHIKKVGWDKYIKEMTAEAI